MSANSREFLDREEEVLEAVQNGDKRTIADLEQTILVSTRMIVETLYKVRN